MQRPTRFQIMRARRLEDRRWERVRRQREIEECLSDHQKQLLQEQHGLVRQMLNGLPDRQALIAKIDECERQEVAGWAQVTALTGPRSPTPLDPDDLGRLQETPPEPKRGWLSRLFFWNWC